LHFNAGFRLQYQGVLRPTRLVKYFYDFVANELGKVLIHQVLTVGICIAHAFSCRTGRKQLMKHFSAMLLLTMALVFSHMKMATATPIVTFTGDCSSASCFGSTYTLTVDNRNDLDPTTYAATLSIDTTNYSDNIPPPVYVDAVDIKLVNSIIANSLSLFDAPGGTGGWTLTFDQGQAAQDCAGSGGGFFICSNDIGSNTLAPVGGILNWTWNFASTDTISFGHIGASYNNEAGTVNGHNTSISNATSTPGNGTPGNGTPSVPEPSTLILLGCGLLFVGAVTRKWQQA
jgi:hypothetical protein